jgi:enamine deaminase RidA (YjgF/YER057c/UK114 family)
MDKTGINNGGVWRVSENGVLDIERGLPEVRNGRVFSFTGWGSMTELKQAGVGVKGTEIPQMWLCGGDGTLPPVYQRFIVEGAKPSLITRDNCTVGLCYEDNHARYCLLTGILPPDTSVSRIEQTSAVFEAVEDALKDANMTFDDVVRTWLYMDDILDWYDDFNRTRDDFFRSRNVYDGLVPASTGIGSANLYGSAFTACAIAVTPKDDSTYIIPVTSPLQCAALDYGSSFSRAVEIGTPDYRTLMISGTASIEPGGLSAFVGDVDRQIQLTMDVVEGIMKARAMNWSDATRVVMYLKKSEFLDNWRNWLQKNKLENLPLINIEADVCRDDLLVELEVDCVKPV